jgi:hypothetical protein
VIVAGLVAATAVGQVNLYNVATIDTGPDGLAIGVKPGSVAFNGTDLYVGSLFGGATITKISNPLASPAIAGTFGNGPTTATTNGFVNLDVYGNRIVAGTNNGGADPDLIQVFDLSGNLIVQNDSDTDPTNYGRFDGVALDPGYIAGGGGGAGVHIAYFGGGNRYLHDTDTLALLNNAFSLWNPDHGSTGFRDVVYNKTNGDLYMRTVAGIIRGQRVGDNDFVKFTDGTAGMDNVVKISDGFSSAINVEFMDNVDGMDLVFGNWRGSPVDTFAGQNFAFDASATTTSLGGAVAVNWLNADGSGPFDYLDAASGSGIFDYSYDPATGLLAISDFDGEKVYFFSRVPEPASLLLIGLAGLMIRRR